MKAIISVLSVLLMVGCAGPQRQANNAATPHELQKLVSEMDAASKKLDAQITDPKQNESSIQIAKELGRLAEAIKAIGPILPPNVSAEDAPAKKRDFAGNLDFLKQTSADVVQTLTASDNELGKEYAGRAGTVIDKLKPMTGPKSN